MDQSVVWQKQLQLVSSSRSDMPNILNMANSIIGVSILAMPWCFSQVGIILGSALLFIGAITTKLACQLLMSCLDHAYSSTRPHLLSSASFEILALNVLGKRAKLLVELSTIGYLLGVCIAFLVVMGDMLPQMTVQLVGLPENLISRTTLLLLITIGIALPLSLIQRMETLYSLSALSITFYIVFLFKVFCDAYYRETKPNWSETLIFWRLNNFLVVLPICLTGLSCQTQVFIIYDSLGKGASADRMNSIVSDSINFCFFLYWFVGLFGYVAFGEKTDGDVLINFDSSLTSNLIKLSYMITVAISFPLCIFPCRRSVETLLFYPDFNSKLEDGHHPDKSGLGDWFSKTIEDNRFSIITVGLIVIILLAAIFIPNIETILNLSGSTMGASICFLFPAAIALKVHSQTQFSHTQIRSICLVIFGIGIFICISCLFEVFFWTEKQALNHVDVLPAASQTR